MVEVHLGTRAHNSGKGGGMKTTGFKIGDTVEWTSQSHGYEKTKRGKIYCVIPENAEVSMYASLRMPGLPRNHESYVVNADGKLYWPRVSALKLVKRGR